MGGENYTENGTLKLVNLTNEPMTNVEVFIKEEIDWDSLKWLTKEVLYCFPNSWLFFFPQFISHCNILLSLMFLDFVTPYYLGTLSYLISQHAKGINTECRV